MLIKRLKNTLPVNTTLDFLTKITSSQNMFLEHSNVKDAWSYW